MRSLLALLAGVLHVCAFAPFDYWVLIFISIGILFWLWLHADTKTAFWYGFLYGLGLFGVGVSWTYVSISTHGGMPSIIAGICVFVLVAILALYPALTGVVQALFGQRKATPRLTFIMPVIWVFFEWIRSWLFTGFPWLITGYSMLDTPLSNFAPIGGVYLLSLIALITTGLLVSVVRNTTVWNTVLVLCMLGIWGSGWQLNQTAWTQAKGDPIRVAVIQNNVSLDEKWEPVQSERIIQGYLAKSRLQQDVDLVVWPEAAIPNYISDLEPGFWDTIRDHPADFMMGVLHRERIGQEWRYYNIVAAVSDRLNAESVSVDGSPSSHRVMIYRKQHLVPFGEYYPLSALLGPLLSLLDIPMVDFSHWNEPQLPLIAAGNRFAVSICYEDAFPGVWRSQIHQSGALLNVSEDLWFGDSLAPHQRLQMARFRSRESERPMIRSSNNGLSSLINWKGGVDEYAPQFQQHVVKGSIQPRIGETPYVRYGDSVPLILAGMLLCLSLLFGRPIR